METSDYGVTYNIVSTSIPVASFDGKTITFSAADYDNRDHRRDASQCERQFQ